MEPKQTPPELNPQYLSFNIQAIAQRQPDVAALFERVTVPDDIELAQGRDGETTFRWPAQNGQRRWLGESSMPSVSSAALMAEFGLATGNILLPSLGHGWEAAFLLRQLPPHQAIFAWDCDPLIPALTLRLHDFSRHIASGRLVFAIGPSLPEAMVSAS